MKYLDLTLPSPEANLACDEALLDSCEEQESDEILRVWESPSPFVVLGYANQAAREVRLDVCLARKVPVLRRCTGGGTVLQGPGCLSYALCLRISDHTPLESITGTNRWIMERHRGLFTHLLQQPVQVEGHTDLAVHNRKFSGNSQRRKRRFVLFHGSFLLRFDLALIEQLLPPPSKQPDYRLNRSHTDFLRNVPLNAAKVREALRTLWNAAEPLTQPPTSDINRLVTDRYSTAEWNHRF